jgi:hypothetical protein
MGLEGLRLAQFLFLMSKVLAAIQEKQEVLGDLQKLVDEE